ncbi:ATP-binding protein [Uliginosibacterium sp. 31-16]|uniref:ATP-binding protein n=1 Tax=Uliginosibacterium sp. 31-16 TaxID=3068315 RepID=UPI00273EF851|nr:ATP-binding protein [Uliginosibacterium sp. 31-16]MDP5239557.1 ATP-binding protein [Uliginosibacterium sp. 31-16]
MPRFPWPRTLLWRSFLLIALLLVGSLLAWLQIYNYYALRPRAAQTAQLVVSMVNLTRSALLAADDTQRLALLHDLNSLEGIRVLPAENDDRLVALPDTALMRKLQESVRTRLGSYTRFSAGMNELEGFFVSFRVDESEPEDEYWIMLPRERIAGPAAAEWLGWGSAAILIALLAAYLLVLGLTRPLKALEGAARAVGRGAPVPILPEDGAREVASVAQAFNQMSHDLTELESDRALILAGVSHDLRTPLARLRLGIEMSGAHADDVAAMGQDIEEMDRIIGQFLDFARGGQTESPQECDVVSLVQELARSYQARGTKITLTLPEKALAPVRLQSLRRAIINLVDNALRYAGAELSLEISVRAHAQDLEIEVTDRGPGIPADQVERLKRPFTRLENARSNAQGSGLGLAIVDRVARLHGGHLDLLPGENGGLRASLHLKC